MRNLKTLAVVLLALAATACSGGNSNGNGGGGGPPPAASLAPPTFRGTVSVSTAGGNSIRLDWRDAFDDATAIDDIRYQVFLSSNSMGHDFNAPVVTTAPGANFAILDASDSQLIQPGSRIFVVVRALDHEGNRDDNVVETFVQVVPLANVAYVEQLVGTTTEVALGVLGDMSQPFYGIQSAVAAVELAGGGVVLVHGLDSPLGQLWQGEVDITDTSPSVVEIYGGFPRFSTLSTGTVGEALLAQRDPARYITVVTAPAQVDDDVVFVNNVDVPTVVDGFVFAEPGVNNIQGMQAVLQVSGCGFVENAKAVFGNRAGNSALQETASAGSEFRLIGSTFDYRNQTMGPDHATWTGGMLTCLRVQNCDFYDVDAPITTRDRNGDWLTIPTGATLEVWLTHNKVVEADGSVEFEVHAFDTAYASHYVLYFERNELNDVYDHGLDASNLADVGQNGTAKVYLRENLLVGISDDGMALDMDGNVNSPGVIVDLEVERNSILNTNASDIWLRYTIGAGGKTAIKINDNILGACESEVIDLYQASVPAGTADSGLLSFEIQGNVSTGGGEDMYLEFTVAPMGRTEIDVIGNTILSSYDYGIELYLDGYAGLGTATYPTPNGIFNLNVVGNRVQGTDSAPIYFGDNRHDDDSLAFGLIANNVFAFCLDSSYASGFYGDFYGRNAIWLIQRNFMGSGGQDSEAALDVYAPRYAAPSNLRIENNVLALAHGPGLEIEYYGPRSQIINNTMAFNGEDGESGVEASNDDSQLLIQNCIVSHSGGVDIDPDQLEACYSIVRSVMPTMGYANFSGEPNYDLGGAQFLQLSSDPSAVIASILSLAPASQCIDAADPDPFMNDPDGSRCDMGAYGGPGSGTIGPIVGMKKAPLVFLGTHPNVDLYTGATLVDPTQKLALVFSQPIDANTIGAITFSVNGSSVPGNMSLVPPGRMVEFQPTSTLDLGSTHIVRVDIGGGLMAADGQALRYPKSFTFGVRPLTPLVSIEPNSVDDSFIDAADMAAAQIVSFGPGAGVLALTGQLYDPLDIDVYGIQLDPGDRIMATLIEGLSVIPEVPGDAEIVVDLYRADGTLVHRGCTSMFERGPSSPDEPYLDFTVAQGGAYFLVVRDEYGSVYAQDYELQAVIR